MKKEKKCNSEISKNLTNSLIEIHNDLYEIDPTDHTVEGLIGSDDIANVFNLLNKVADLNFMQPGYKNEFILQQILNYTRVHSQRIHRFHFEQILTLMNEFNVLIEGTNIKTKPIYSQYLEKIKAFRNEFNVLIEGTNIKTKPYYSEYEKIKLEKGYTKNEKDFIYNTLEYSEFNTWTYAFIVLAIRKKDNINFKNALIKMKNNTIFDITNLECLIAFAKKFHDNYKKYINDKKKRK